MERSSFDIRMNKGFTLLELLLVIVVVGILAALALPQYVGFAERSRAAEALASIGAIKNAELAVRLESASFTSNMSNLSVQVPTTGSATYWIYNVTGADADSFAVTATRTSKKAGSAADQTIILTWNETSSPKEAWSGNHTGVPR